MNVTQEEITKLLNETSHNLFITGGAGTGKSYVINQWLETKPRDEVAICAPTGVAALNVKGITLHRMFHIPFSIANIEYQATIAARKMKEEKKDYLNKISTLLIDEISMVRSDILSFIDNVLKEVRDSDEPFGGVRLIAVGDPFQLPPVVPKHEKEKLPKPWFFQANIWWESGTKTLNLTKVYRQEGDATFADVLNNIRRGRHSYKDLLILNKRKDFAKENAMILGTTNKKVEDINSNELEALDEEEFMFLMSYKNYVDDYYIEKSILAPIQLFLKKGARVMMLSNKNNWVNGSLGTIESIHVNKLNEGKSYIRVLLDGQERSTIVERHKWKAEECSMNGEHLMTDVLGEAKQFPMKLGYAVTVHKSQGMTFPNMHFALDYVFERGQSYVALSRAVSLEGLTLSKKIQDRDIIYDRDVKKFMQGV